MARGQRSATPDVVPGVVLDDRYQLVREQSAESWVGVDQLLNRPVEIRPALDLDDAEVKQLDAFATAAGQVSDARWLRLLDVGRFNEQASDLWFVVEDPAAPSLRTRLTTGALPADEAIALGEALVEALLSTASDQRAGALDCDRVFVVQDSVRLDGINLTAARAGAVSTEREDVMDVGAILFAALTGRIEPAARPTSPRRLRGGIPRALDSITTDALSGNIATLATLQRRLGELPRRKPENDGPSRRSVITRKVLVHAFPPLLIAAVGLAAWTIGSNLGAIPGADRPNAVSTFTPEPVTAQLAWTTPPKVRVLGGTDDAAGAALAVDSSFTTAWLTDDYSRADYGGTKPTGLGLLIDLGRSKSISEVRIRLTIAGAGLTLRAGDTKPTTAEGLPYIRHLTATTEAVKINFAKPHKARYWLIQLTSLPAEPKQSGNTTTYGEGIAQFALLH